MNFPKELHYTKTHEWAQKNTDSVTVGISDYAQHEISDIVFVELPKVGQKAVQGKVISVVESVKAAFDIYAPVSGTVKSINTMLESDPSIVNRDCYRNGWFFEITPDNTGEWSALLTVEQYETFLKEAAH